MIQRWFPHHYRYVCVNWKKLVVPCLHSERERDDIHDTSDDIHDTSDANEESN